jgi:hypothetical protein
VENLVKKPENKVKDSDEKDDSKDVDNDLEDDLDEDSDEDDKLDTNISYSFEQEKVFNELHYAGGPLDYVKLWYGENEGSGSFDFEDDYWGFTHVNDVDSEMLSTEEAQKTFTEIQYATVMGDSVSVSSIDKRKFDTWIKFNKHLFQMFETMYSVTRDVDYKPLV